MQEELSTYIQDIVKEKIVSYIVQKPVQEMTSLEWIQEVARSMAREISLCVFTAWKEAMVKTSQLFRPCPCCGQTRKCKWRNPITVDVLGFSFELPKLYLECGRCNAPGISIMKLLTGLTSGDASMELLLAAGYCAAQHSYGKASQDLKVHYGQEVERTKVRRMALAVEKEAMAFAENTRRQCLERIAGEAQLEGCPELILEADGGKVRTGELMACEPGDPGYGKKTPKRKAVKRKRPTSYREVVTIDVRAPGEMEASALDVLVPVLAKDGERARRMLALASRKGLGDNTQILGLGDMGSGLASSFEEAFVGYDSFWSADWKHTRDYVQAASKVLRRLDSDQWAYEMRQSIWDRDEGRRDELLRIARRHRVRRLPAEYEKCPVQTLGTYLKNNWNHMKFSRQTKQGLPIVSARAESQVRDRTKNRFCVAGAWLVKNIEPKAILRSIIAEGRWEEFRVAQIAMSKTAATRSLIERIKLAVEEGRIQSEISSNLIEHTIPTRKAA